MKAARLLLACMALLGASRPLSAQGAAPNDADAIAKGLTPPST